MKFAKYHGIGNDFLVVDLRDAPEQLAWWAERAVALCDRRFGVGGDGIAAILPPRTAAAVRMEVINSDGSIAEMCGNALRCVVRELVDRGNEGRRGFPSSFSVETNAGILACSVAGESITVMLGPPRLSRGEIPMIGEPDELCLDQPYQLPGEPERRMTGLNTGNPHAVTFVESADEARRLARTLGPVLEVDPRFPLKANIEFAAMRSRDEIDLHVWERACGLTLACGTGASATAVAAVLTGRADVGEPITIYLPGGTLDITVMRHLADVAMCGTATFVCDGYLPG